MRCKDEIEEHVVLKGKVSKVHTVDAHYRTKFKL